jgi:hypothetical protein
MSHFVDLIRNKYKNEEVDIFVDMDGVIACYDVGKPYDFLNKRPLLTNINTLKELSDDSNIHLHILSICHTKEQIDEKNTWLDKYAPFFKDRVVISKDNDLSLNSGELKANYLKEFNTNNKIIMIDDDNSVIHLLRKEVEGIILYQDSELID